MPVKTIDVSGEYAKNDDLKKEDIEALQQWVEKQPHLPKLNELQLILFLQSCYCKIEATKTTIDNFFTARTHCPDFFANRDPNSPRTRESMECGLFSELPKRTPEGYRVLFFTFVDGDPARFVMVDQVKLMDMNVLLWLQEGGTANGLVMIFDVKKLTLGHVARMSLFSLKTFFTYLQDAIPIRLKGMHFVNAGVAAEKFLMLSKPFIKAELLEVLHLHADISESVYKIVPKEYLPKDYGGTADSVSDLHDKMKKKLLDSADYFIEDEKLKSDESKRVEKRTTFDIDTYGMDGSFKKLEID